MSDLLDSVAPREREVLELLLSNGEASALDVQESLHGPVSNSAVRTMLYRLTCKGLVSRRKVGQRYLYRAAIPVEQARRRALIKVLQVFFDGSPGRAALALLGSPKAKISKQEIKELEALLRKAKGKRQ